MRALWMVLLLSFPMANIGCDERADGDADGDVDADGDADAEGDSDVDEPGDGDAEPTACSFNSDCDPALRCECDEATGCFCLPGERGAGVSGVDRCVDGNDCQSSLCVEGPGDLYYCSGECGDEEDCGPMLPRCIDVAFVGRICVREPV